MDPVDDRTNIDPTQVAASNGWRHVLRMTGLLLYYLVYPVLILLWKLLSLLFLLLTTILAPFIYAGQAVLYIAGAPLRLLAKFEPLFYFLGYAVLIGGAAGLILGVTHRLLKQIFNLSSNPPRSPLPVKKAQSRYSDHKSEESSDSTSFEDHESQDLAPRHSGEKSNNTFSLSKFYADWINPDDLVLSKEPDLISSTIIEEDDDSQEAWD